MTNRGVDVEFQPRDEQQLEGAKGQCGPSPFDTYQTSLTTRYCSPEMSRLYSQRSRHSQWRALWLFLAECEKELGIETITAEALEQMRQHLEVTDADFEIAKVEEKRRRHDVMAHVHAFGAVAPAAAGIIHYGATSCYITDNTELLLMRDAINLLLPKLARVISNLAKFAMEWKAMPTLAYTHLQAAQLITVGKRAAQWAQDLVLDLESIEHARDGLLLRGAQGTTGTQASFLEIFGGDGSKCDQLNELLCQKTGFAGCYDVSTQTYTRKVDLIIANAICGLGATAQRITGDIRHLASWKEVEEPFETDQIGSSAMAYKRNPMRSERVYSLARELLSKPANFANTLSDQWMERTLDDSAIRRIDIPEIFLLADAVLGGLDNITSGLVVYPERIASRVQEELPFMITESLIMRLCAKGLSRQEAHEQIRVLSHQAARVVKIEGKPNDLVSRIKATSFFQPIWGDIDDMLRSELYIGRSVEIVERYCGPEGVVEKKIQPYKADIEKSATTELNV
ncbi:adenylosuccinate lyase [Talaromyces proteolyticus]|uniref:Adenylosuccinate lyase n=1 Tax=Talaromyces proteolyticus TaxID=1131652 RepID=A0AAD4L163_9EURO|nr:adenylosuccinate lyase [Talaromyces proteolyticus]KAH8705663.1 adenylosuccinate lyase [Talaromyces proteolyticus]